MEVMCFLQVKLIIENGWKNKIVHILLLGIVCVQDVSMNLCYLLLFDNTNVLN